MKHLRESDSFAGSNYAYTTAITTNKTDILKVGEPISYNCDDCRFDFFTYEDEEFCTLCGSQNIKKIN
jgi:rRNA maturation endonuclease Nob1